MREKERLVLRARTTIRRGLKGLAKMADRERLKVMHRYVVAGAALLLGITVLVIAFAVQDHDERVLAEDLDRTGVELQLLGRQISDI